MKFDQHIMSFSRWVILLHSRRPSPCVCIMHNKCSTKVSMSIKDEKKQMFKTLGDDLLEDKVQKVRHKLLFNSHIKFGLDIPISYIGRKKLIARQFNESRKYEEIVQSKSLPISLKFLGNAGKLEDSNYLGIHYSCASLYFF